MALTQITTDEAKSLIDILYTFGSDVPEIFPTNNNEYFVSLFEYLQAKYENDNIKIMTNTNKPITFDALLSMDYGFVYLSCSYDVMKELQEALENMDRTIWINEAGEYEPEVIIRTATLFDDLKRISVKLATGIGYIRTQLKEQ